MKRTGTAVLLSAEALKNELWDTLLSVKKKETTPEVANSVAGQAREISRVVKLQIQMEQVPQGKRKSITF